MHNEEQQIKEGMPPKRASVVERFSKHRPAIVGATVVFAIALIAILAPWIAPHDPLEQFLGRRLEPPSREFLMGTDTLARCLLTRVIYGTRVSMTVGPVAAGITLTLGVIVGSLSGFYGGRIDMVLQRIVDIVMCIPSLFLIIAVVALFGASMTMTMVVIGLVHWTSPARLVRGEIMKLKEEEYVLAAQSLGARDGKIIFQHILPNIVAPLIVYTTLFVANAILIEAGLSYLGLGTQPPAPSWGNILTAGGQQLHRAWWMTVFPGAAIFLTILSINLMGDGLRDALDPKQHY